jgi:hypothetical protein
LGSFVACAGLAASLTIEQKTKGEQRMNAVNKEYTGLRYRGKPMKLVAIFYEKQY